MGASLALVGGVTSAQATPHRAAATTSAATVVRQESPVDSQGALRSGMKVAHHYGDATCQTGSTMTGTAYRCSTPQSRQSLYDPCWVSDHTDVVYCQAAPWQHDVVRLAVTGGFDDSAGFSHVARPWGVRLRSGRRCLPDVASVRSVGGHAISYTCPKRTVIVNRLDTSHATWRAHVYRSVGRRGHRRWKSFGRQPITTAWRGVKSLTAS
jgi:hypothetical protein